MVQVNSLRGIVNMEGTFESALSELKQGYKLARAGWNGKGMWIALGEGSTALSADKFWNVHSKAHAVSMGGSCTVAKYIIFKDAHDNIQMGWQPSQADMLAEDWSIVP